MPGSIAMHQPELRSEPRVPVSYRGTLTVGDKSVACTVQNMCSRGFLIRYAQGLPVGQAVRLRCELYPEEPIECTVQVRHVNRECLGARIVDISEDAKRICLRYLDEQRALAARRPATQH